MYGTGLLATAILLGVARNASALVLDVTAFGAVPNDGAADAAAIMSAVAASGAGDTVLFPAGTYLITESIHPASGTTLAGVGRETTILRYIGAGFRPLIDLTDRSDVEVTTLTLDGNASRRAANGIIATNGSGHWLHDLSIRNFRKGEGFGPHGIHFAANVTDSLIADTVIDDIGTDSEWGAGMRFSHGSSRNRILRNTISRTGRGGILADNGSVDLVIQHNAVSGSGGEGLGIEIWDACDRVLIEDNIIDHWLSLNRSSGCAVRRNVIRDPTGIHKYIGLELAGGSNNLFSDNVVGAGQKLGVSVSTASPKDNVYWAFNTVGPAASWAVQLQGEDAGVTHHYFYGNTFRDTPVDNPNFAHSDPGHGFRMNGACYAITLDSNVIVDNAVDGIQFSGSGFDRLSFLDNSIARNAGDSVSGDPGAANLLWSGNTVISNGFDRDLASRGFSGPPPSADFTEVAFAVAGQPVPFANHSIAGTGALVRTLWDFGEGLPATEENPVHTFEKAGIYRVTLVVWDSSGLAARKERLVQVAAAADSGCAILDCRTAGDQCSYPSCSDASGQCEAIAKPEGTACDDELFCTSSDACSAGACSGSVRECSDGDRCTDDGCDEGAAICTHAPIPNCGPQSRLQQRCLVAMSRAYQKLAKVRAKVTAACISAGARGATDALACLSRDSVGKLAAAASKVQRASALRCTCQNCALPTFGYAADVTAAIASVEAADPMTAIDLFGASSTLGLIESGADASIARCQQGVHRSAQKVAAAHWSDFLGCLKNGLRGKVTPAEVQGESFVLVSELSTCLDQGPSRRTERARARLLGAAVGCSDAGVSFSSFGGACGVLATADGFAACLATAVESRAGQAMAAAHDL